MGVDVEKYTGYVNERRQSVGLETWKLRQMVTSQIAQTKCKWPPYDPEPKPPHENFLRTPLVSRLSQFTDMFTKFNEVNLQLQGNGVNLIKVKSAIFTFLSRFRSAKDFSTNFPKLDRKAFVQFCLQIFSYKYHEDFFWCDLQEKSCVFFCKPQVSFFEVKQRWAPFILGFSGIFLRFSANQNFWGCTYTPAIPPPTPLLS